MSDKSFSVSLVELLSKTSGRDKLCRVVQYATRFLAAHKREKAQFQPVKEDLIGGAVKLEALGASMAMTRKLLRFGRVIDLSIQIKQTLAAIQSGEIKNVPRGVVKILSALSLALYFLFDHVLFFGKIGWIQDKGLLAQTDYFSNLFWLLDCIFSLIRCAIDRRDLHKMDFSSKKRTAKELKFDVPRNLLDIPLAYGFMYPGAVPNKVMGILGTITSIIGIAQLWN